MIRPYSWMDWVSGLRRAAPIGRDHGEQAGMVIDGSLGGVTSVGELAEVAAPGVPDLREPGSCSAKPAGGRVIG